jgi:hypothetical protein
VIEFIVWLILNCQPIDPPDVIGVEPMGSGTTLPPTDKPKDKPPQESQDIPES